MEPHISPPRGFEPLTPRLTVVCSNQLSYGRKTVLLVLTRTYHVEVELIMSRVHRVGFEPTQHTLPGLKSGSLDHSDIDAESQHPWVFFIHMKYTKHIVVRSEWNPQSHLPHDQLFVILAYTHEQFQDSIQVLIAKMRTRTADLCLTQCANFCCIRTAL